MSKLPDPYNADQLSKLDKRLRRQEAKALGPTLGEFYGQFEGLPALRGLWYPGSLDSTGAMFDRSGQTRTLTYTGNPTLDVHNSLVPYWNYDGTDDCHVRGDESGLDILGTETYIAASRRGLTMGGWFWVDAAGSANVQCFMAKWGAAAADQSYAIRYDSNLRARAFISNGAGTTPTASNANGSWTSDTWHFVVMRFRPSVALDIMTDMVTVSNTTAPQAVLVNGAAQFEVGRLNATNLQNLDGRCGLAFLAAAAWSDELLNYLFQRSRPLFGV